MHPNENQPSSSGKLPPGSAEVIPETLRSVRDWLQGLHDRLELREGTPLGFDTDQVAAFRQLFRAVLAPVVDQREKKRELARAHAAVMETLQKNPPGARREVGGAATLAGTW